MLLMIVTPMLIAIAVALIAVAAATRVSDRIDVRSTMNLVASQTLTSIPLVASEVTDQRSLFERAFAPIVRKAVRLGSLLTPPGYVASVQRRLTMCGRGQKSELDRWLAGRLVTIGVLPVLVGLVVILPFQIKLRLALFVLFGVVLLLGPDAVLNRKVAARQERIRVQLPNLLDLLTISVGAGLGFEQALSRTVVAVPGPLSEEFARMLQRPGSA